MPLYEVMKAVKYLFAVWAGVLIYALLSVMFGDMGFSAYRQLENERKKQEANIESLVLLNRDLENSMNALLYDRDLLAVQAREQGYATRQERFMRIVGLGVNQRSTMSPGEVVFAAEPQYTQDYILKIIALCTGITILICMAVFDALKYIRER